MAALNASHGASTAVLSKLYPVRSHTGGENRATSLRRPYQQRDREAGAAGLLRRRSHRAHDPADPVSAVHQEQSHLF
ncbi:MAG: hypothetical protein P8X64_10405 [Anaerolineales bacterium]